ncbi:MAG: hypothetical protein JNL74_02590 [Fibrobacteres bacterium]|nr:hypothetical protein [Fibrobacterota bacterium]
MRTLVLKAKTLFTHSSRLCYVFAGLFLIGSIFNGQNDSDGITILTQTFLLVLLGAILSEISAIAELRSSDKESQGKPCYNQNWNFSEHERRFKKLRKWAALTAERQIV